MTKETRKIDLNKSKEKKRVVNLFNNPLTPNAIASGMFGSSSGASVYLTEGSIIDHYLETASEVKKGDLSTLEDMLVSQSLLLNNIFCESSSYAAHNMNDYPKASQTYMNMALKAQSQCRCTVEAINEIKNPKSVTITKQANISEQQIVNNGNMNTGSHAEKNVNQSNELLSEVKHEKVDTRTTTSAKRANTANTTVETINRSKNT